MFLLALFPVPALAWEFSPDPICTLRHETENVQMVVTHDTSAGIYTLNVTAKGAVWQPSDTFGMQFTGGAQISIGTTRHRLTDDARTLSVSDTGFGNVLDGLEFNPVATAFTQTQSVSVRTDGIAAPMAAFRACPEAQPATS